MFALHLCFLGALVAAAVAVPGVERIRLPSGQVVLVAAEYDREIQWVTEQVAIGNQNAACNAEHLLQEGVTHVVSLIGDLDCASPDVPRTVIDVDDVPGQNMAHAFRLANDVIVREIAQQGRVLVHCAAGVSRSSATIIYHLMMEQGMSYDSALQSVQLVRSISRPNYGFEQQLRVLEGERKRDL